MEETNFGAWLKEKRMGLGISQAKLAEQTSISKGYLGHLEQFTKSPSVEKCRVLARALMVSETEIMTEAGYYPKGAEVHLDEDELEHIRQLRQIAPERRMLIKDLVTRYYESP